MQEKRRLIQCIWEPEFADKSRILVLVEGQWCSDARKVTAGLAYVPLLIHLTLCYLAPLRLKGLRWGDGQPRLWCCGLWHLYLHSVVHSSNSWQVIDSNENEFVCVCLLEWRSSLCRTLRLICPTGEAMSSMVSAHKCYHYCSAVLFLCINIMRN